jgi:PKD repeat protein
MYLWNFGDGTTGSGASPSHTYTADGIDTVSVTATDVDGASSQASMVIEIFPSVSAGSNVSTNEGTAVNFQGSAAGGALTYLWDFGDGGTAAGTLTPSHVYNQPGTFTATLTATDSFGLSSQSSLQVTVNDVPPTVDIGGPYSGIVGSPVSFLTSASEPVNPQPSFSYAWNFGDGSTGAGSSPTHTYTQVDNYTVALTVTDPYNGSTTATAVVTVAPNAAGSASSLTVTGFPTPDTAGAAGNVTVTALDAFGNIATGYRGTIHITSTDNRAVLPVNYTFVAADAGTHTFSVTLETAATQSITATDTSTPSLTGSETSIVVGAAAASSLTVSGFPTPDTAGVAHNVTVTAHDPYGNVATGFTGTIHFTSTDSQAVLPTNYTFVAADAGTHTFSVTLDTAGNQSITALAVRNPTIIGSETGIAVGAAAASSLTITGFPSPDTAGTAHNVTVTARDPYGNVATGYTGTVHFTSTDSQAVLPANYTFLAGDAGTHSFSVTLKTVGTRSISATDTVTSSITGTESGIAVGAAAASSLTVTGFPSPDTAGTAHNVTVSAFDPYGNIATGYTGSVHFTSSDSQALLPANYTFVAADAGTHTFTVTLKTAATQSITATDTATSSITGSETGITVQAAAASSLTVSGFPTPDTAGVGHHVTVTAYDAYGNVATGYLGTVHFTSTDSQASLPANYTFVAADAGTHTFFLTLKTAATQSITATDTANSTINGSETGITVQAAAASSLTITGLPGTVTAGTPNIVTVTAYDAYGNIATGYLGTIHFTSTDSQASLPANYTYSAGDAGAHVFSVTLSTPGSQTIAATDTATSSITGSAGATVTAAGTLVVSAGSNVTTSEGATVTFAGTVSGGTSPYTYLWNFGDGSATSGTTAGFVQTNTTTQGNWIGVYGAAGYNVIGDAANYPSYAIVTASGQSSHTWASSTTNVRALQKPENPTDRLAACWYSFSSFLVDVNLTDSRLHPFSIYALDWDSTSRSERIDVLDASSGATLDTRTISSFSGGEYLTWNMSGHVQFRVATVAGANAVISGLFIGNSLNSNIGTLTPSHTYTQRGTYTVSLTAIDSAGRSGTSNLVATVADVAPTATLTAPAGGNYGIPVSFSASATSPSPIDQAAGFTYNWNFGDGTTGSGASPTHIYTAVGTYTVSVTATDTDGATSQPASSPIQITQRVTQVYYVAPNPTSGTGTLTNPFGLPDLLTSSFQIGPALTILQPGDTLYFRGGDYHISDTSVPSGNHMQYIYPQNSGTALLPITLSSYPGEIANIIGDTGAQRPILGSDSPRRDDVQFLGFRVTPGVFLKGSDTFEAAGIDISGTGNEIAYNEIVGHTITYGDNHAGIWLDTFSTNTNLNHNYVHDFNGPGDHSVGILVWSNGTYSLTDNYTSNNGRGVVDKANSGSDFSQQGTIARNYISDELEGCFEGFRVTTQIYDNVIGVGINLGGADQYSNVYNNLFLNLQVGGIGQQAIGLGGAHFQIEDSNFWNNVFGATSPGVDVFSSSYQNYVKTDPGATFSYLDYNFYTATPRYQFVNVTDNFAQMLADGWEAHSAQVASLTNIYQDLVSYVLKPAYQTAGRYGDAVGPRPSNITVAQILDPARYGPAAYAGAGPAVAIQPSNQAVNGVQITPAGAVANGPATGTATSAPEAAAQMVLTSMAPAPDGGNARAVSTLSQLVMAMGPPPWNTAPGKVRSVVKVTSRNSGGASIHRMGFSSKLTIAALAPSTQASLDSKHSLFAPSRFGLKPGSYEADRGSGPARPNSLNRAKA